MQSYNLRIIMNRPAVFMLLFLSIYCNALPIAQEGTHTYLEYLKRFGWLDGGTDDIDDEVAISLKIEEFQEFAGLEITGIFDEPTIEKMVAPRCGVTDEGANNQIGLHSSRRRRGTFQGSKWSKTSLKYYIGNKTSDLHLSEINEGIQNAVKLWSDNSALSFTEVNNAADADLKFDFVEKTHGDGRDFDGPGKVLAHAFFPNDARRGQIHFDDDETWLGPTKQHDADGTKYNIMILAAHEVGHVLGLEHTSQSSNSLMKPWPVAYQRNFKLPSDEVISIQNLYGKPGNKITLDLCRTKIRFDAALQGPHDRTLFFSGMHFVEIVSSGIKQGYPKLLFDLFPSNIAEDLAGMDAIVMSSKTNKIYVFKDDLLWRFNINFVLETDYPKLIIETGLPDKIDTAFEQKGQIYIIKKKKVFIFNEKKQKALKTTQKLSEAFPGVPKGVSATLTWKNGQTYFFKKDKYYKFDKNIGGVTVGYPREVKGAWLCL